MVDGNPGLALDIEFDDGLAPVTCDRDVDGVGRYAVFAGGEAAPTVKAGVNRWHVVVVQYGPAYRVISLQSYFAGTPAADVEAGRAIQDSIVFRTAPGP